MGLTILDAGVVIGFLDGDDVHHASAHRALGEARERNDRMALPASALAEILVGPSRRGPAAVATVRHALDRIPIAVAALDGETAERAAGLRAQHPTLKLPDALVIATADVLDADRLVTTDRRWPTSRQLGLRAIISEL